MAPATTGKRRRAAPAIAPSPLPSRSDRLGAPTVVLRRRDLASANPALRPSLGLARARSRGLRPARHAARGGAAGLMQAEAFAEQRTPQARRAQLKREAG